MQPVAFKVVAGTRASLCFANPAWYEECHGVWIFFVVVVFGLLCVVKWTSDYISEALASWGSRDVTLLVFVVCLL